VVFITVQNLAGFDNMHVFRFPEFGLKTTIHAPITGRLGSHMKKPKKRHILARVRVVWAIMRENTSTGMTCMWVPKKGRNKKVGYISPMSLPWTDVHLIWHSYRGRRRNHLWQIFGDRLKSVDSVGGQKFWAGTTAQPVIYKWFSCPDTFISFWDMTFYIIRCIH